MKGFAYPRMLLNKHSFIATNSNFRHIGLIVDLLQEHPEMFTDTATTLLYVLNLGTNYKQDILYSIFKSFIYQDYATSKDIKAMNVQTVSPTENIIVADSIPTLFTYYLLKNKVYKPFEPSLELVYNSLKEFENNPDVYYNNKKYRISEIKPLFYNLAGFNFTEFLINYAYYTTYLIYGRPYSFYDEIGSSSAAKGLLSDIDAYFEGLLKLLTKDTQIPINSYSAQELYANYVTADQLKALQGCLNKMLDFEEIIKLRNREMNKTSELLDENYRNQNELTQDFIKTQFLMVLDNLIKIGIEENPFTKVLEKIPMFIPTDLIYSSGASRPINFDELIDITMYAISGGKSEFKIDSNQFYRQVFKAEGSESSKNVIIFEEQSDKPAKQELKSKINTYNRCMKIPFSNSDIILKMLGAYIKQKFIAQQDSFMDTPEIGMDITEPIKIDHTDFNDYVFKQTLENYLLGFWYDNKSAINTVLKGLLESDKLFKEEFNDIINMCYISEKVYGSKPKAMILSIYLLSWLKDAIELYIKTYNFEKGLTFIGNFNRFKYMNYLTHIIVNLGNTQEANVRILKIYDMLISTAFTQTDEYARFVNITETDFDKYLMNSILQNVYISGNTDMCELYSIGGINMYNKMLDPNPFNRGYAFMSDIYGTSENIEYVKNMCAFFKDKSLIDLITDNVDVETIYTVMKRYARDYALKHPFNLNNYNITLKKLEDSEISEIQFEQKNMIDWIDLKMPNSETYIFEFLLDYAFNQIVGKTHDNEFRSKELKVLESGILNANSLETINKISYTSLDSSDKKEIPVDLSSTANIYSLPVLKYIGEWQNIKCNFVNPTGTKLIKFDLLGYDHKYNMCIFMFTNAKLDTKFNTYA